MIILSVNSGILSSCCPAVITDRKKTVAEGILSSLASCQFCSTAHLSTVMSNRSVPGGQISTLSLSKWQSESQSSLQPVCALQPLTMSKQALKIKTANLKMKACIQSRKNDHTKRYQVTKETLDSNYQKLWCCNKVEDQKPQWKLKMFVSSQQNNIKLGMSNVRWLRSQSCVMHKLKTYTILYDADPITKHHHDTHLTVAIGWSYLMTTVSFQKVILSFVVFYALWLL